MTISTTVCLMLLNVGTIVSYSSFQRNTKFQSNVDLMFFPPSTTLAQHYDNLTGYSQGYTAFQFYINRFIIDTVTLSSASKLFNWNFTG